MIAAGAPALDFTLPDQDGEPVTLSSLRGQTIVVYFYPKAEAAGGLPSDSGVPFMETDYMTPQPPDVTQIRQASTL
jgi:peroxiredoxin Q/BCP